MGMIKPTVLAACNIDYLKDHGYSFVSSAVQHGHECVLYITDVFDSDDKFLVIQDFLDKYYAAPDVHIRLRSVPSQYSTAESRRVFFSKYRFSVLPEVVRIHGPTLVSDIDAIINKEILIDKSVDVGVYLREDNTVGANDWEIVGMKVAAGILYVSESGEPFAKRLKEILDTLPNRWFCDQHAIYGAYKEFLGKMNILDFRGTDYIDWDFDHFDGSAVIYSAKGARKNHPKYLEIKRRYQ